MNETRRRSVRRAIIVPLVAIAYIPWGHCAGMVTRYQLEIGDGYRLVHSSDDAFLLLDPRNAEVLMIDPVWDGMKLVGYCKGTESILLRAVGADKEGRPTGGPVAYFIVRVSDETYTGPLTDTEFQKSLDSIETPQGGVVWIEPKDPNPGSKQGMVVFFRGFEVMAVCLTVAGYVLPVAFVLLLAHYRIVKRRLEKRSAPGAELVVMES